MNYKSAQKLMSPAIPELLRSYVPDSHGTASYLTIMDYVTSAFLDMLLKPLDRVQRLWTALFFLRIWRQWLMKEGYTMKDSFIAIPTYNGIEINAHSLTQILRWCRDNNVPFLPWLLSSQACEEFSRRARSMTSTFSTIVNFTVLEFIYRAKRIQILLDIRQELPDTFAFAKNKKVFVTEKSSASVTFQEALPSDEEIRNRIMDAKNDALQSARDLGMDVEDDAADAFIDFGDDTLDDSTADDEVNVGGDADDPSEDVVEDIAVISSGAIGLRTFNDVVLDPNSPFVQVKDARGHISIARKSSLTWSLRKDVSLISADRTRRVMEKKTAEDTDDAVFGKTDKISIADWVVFKSPSVRRSAASSARKRVGRVLSFHYQTGKGKQRAYSLDSVPTTAPKNSRGIDVLATWYEVNDEGELTLCSDDPTSYQDIKHYLVTIPRPIRPHGNLCLSAMTFATYF